VIDEFGQPRSKRHVEKYQKQTKQKYKEGILEKKKTKKDNDKQKKHGAYEKMESGKLIEDDIQ
jgi:hypothetical protein